MNDDIFEKLKKAADQTPGYPPDLQAARKEKVMKEWDRRFGEKKPKKGCPLTLLILGLKVAALIELFRIAGS